MPSLGELLAIEVIVVVGVVLLIGTIIPGVRLYWPKHRDPVSRSDLGVALMGGALIAFAVLVLQVMIQVRSESDARDRQEQAERQSLLLVLGRSPNLTGLDLHEEDLSDAYLNRKVLRGANLADADMSDASLQDADLVAANLAGADLARARLDRADLRYADLVGARLVGASLNGVRLDAATLTPRMKDGERTRVDLSDANLSNAWVRADLRGASLQRATLVGTRLAPANLAGADLSGADLEFADLRGANLKGADLDGAINLESVKDLSFAMHDRATKWPKGFTWEGQDPSRCKRSTCRLKKKGADVNDFPPELRAMHEKLANVTKTCLPGWWVDEREKTIDTLSPRERATFHITTAQVPYKLPARQWAFWWQPGQKVQREEIPAISVKGESSGYAERIDSVEDGQAKAIIAVHYFRGSRGFRLWGSAPPELFDVFARDFLKLFRILDVKGDLFPSLRGDKDGCPA